MMALRFEELDYQKTPLGELVLRRRSSPSLPGELVYEVTIDGEMLMSSTVNASERALARLALEGRDDRPLNILVGGLGLGYTAAEALEHPNVQRLVVIELLTPVIAWHRDRLVPMAETLMDDQRCFLVEGDFFEHVGQTDIEQQYDAILLDIDHSPNSWLQARHGSFYSTTGLRGLAGCLRPGGVFALWSDDPPDADFLAVLSQAFVGTAANVVGFPNPFTGRESANTVYVATVDA